MASVNDDDRRDYAVVMEPSQKRKKVEQKDHRTLGKKTLKKEMRLHKVMGKLKD